MHGASCLNAILVSVLFLYTSFSVLSSEDVDTELHKKHLRNHDHKNFWEYERLGELYSRYHLTYWSKYNPYAPRNMRKREWCAQYLKVTPDFPCVRGVVPLGTDSKASIDDGHKFACGISYIGEAPIVYSFGSNKQQDFEVSFLNWRPDAKVWTFELLESHLPDTNQRLSSISYNGFGLGGYEFLGKNPQFQTLTDIMIARGHTYIDVLKIDIEGAEWAWLENEHSLLDRVGQLLIEVHIGCDDEMANYFHFPRANFLSMVETFESHGLRFFYKELNPMWPECCSEFSFIQKEWGKWEEEKKHLPHLAPFTLNGKIVKCLDDSQLYLIQNLTRRSFGTNDTSVLGQFGFQITHIQPYSKEGCDKVIRTLPSGPPM